jgi:hypothetical protein
MSRLSLRELRVLVLDALDDRWTTSTAIADRLGLGHGNGWERVALVLERLAHEGRAELKNPRSRGRRSFRRATRPPGRPRASRIHPPPRGDESHEPAT